MRGSGFLREGRPCILSWLHRARGNELGDEVLLLWGAMHRANEQRDFPLLAVDEHFSGGATVLAARHVSRAAKLILS